MRDPRQQALRQHAVPRGPHVPDEDPARAESQSRVALQLRRDILVAELQREYSSSRQGRAEADVRRPTLLRELATVEGELSAAAVRRTRAEAAPDIFLVDAPPTAPEAAAPAPEPEPAQSPRRRRHPLRRVAFAAFDAVLIAAVALTLFIGYGMVDNRWYHVVAIEGGSMEPTIHKGDLAVIVRAPDKVQVGMVLTMEIEGKVLTHRVVEVHRDGTFVTKGDANTVRDDFRGVSVRVVGEVLFTIPTLGDVLSIGRGTPIVPSPAATP